MKKCKYVHPDRLVDMSGTGLGLGYKKEEATPKGEEPKPHWQRNRDPVLPVWVSETVISICYSITLLLNAFI